MPAGLKETEAPIVKAARAEKRAAYDDRRGTAHERGYGHKWQEARDAYFKYHPLCVACLADEHPVPAEHLDHIVPHKGDMALFWRRSNWQGLCVTHHGLKARIENLYFKGLVSPDALRMDRPSIEAALLDEAAPLSREARNEALWHPKWMRKSLVPVTLVAGPPASGKNTLVRTLSKQGDVVIDVDDIGSRMSGVRGKQWPRTILDRVAVERNRLLWELGAVTDGLHQHYVTCGSHPRVWLIGGEPLARGRQYWVDRLGVDRVIVLDVPIKECERRIRQDVDRRGVEEEHIGWVKRWWNRYSVRSGDEVIECI